jgi:glycosyltransferase EpsF
VRKDIERLMMGADVLLFPSRGEGLGMVAVEAQAAGLPVLASTDVPEECLVVPELVQFLQLSKGVAVWARRLLSMFHEIPDPLISNIKVRESPFSIENSANNLLNLYKESLLQDD